MIEKISIKNFKSHADTTIELGRVTALVGPNGCGKTSLLQAVCALNQFVRQYTTGFMDWEMIHQFIRKGRSNGSLRISVTGSNDAWGITFAGSTLTDLNGKPGIKENKTLIKEFGQTAYFRGIVSELALPSFPVEIPPKLATDGSGLAPVLVNLMTSDRKRREQIEQTLQALVPTVNEINARTVTLKRKEKKVFAVNGAQFPYEEEQDVQGSELIFNTTSGNEIPAKEMSAGTLLALGMLTLLHSSAPDVRLFLLDDVEQGLHPLAQRKLIKTICEFAEMHDKQILFTTHSGYIVDELAPEDVWVLQTDEQGISHAKRLSEHQDAKRLLEVLTTGELADAVGEDWVLPQAPQAIAAGEANA